MKKLLLMATLGIAGALTTQAAETYTVFNNGALGAGLKDYNWWGGAYNFNATAPDGTENVFKFNATNGTNGSMGLNLESGMNTGQLANSTLTFEWYAEGTGTYAIKLTWGEPGIEKTFVTVTEDNANKWNTTTINIATDYPEVSENWNKNVNDGVGYIFSIVLSEGANDPAIYFKNIEYTNVDENWVAPAPPTFEQPSTVPTPSQEASDVLSLFSSKYTNISDFAIAYGWGQQTQIEPMSIAGQNVYFVKNFDYQGWTINSGIDVSGYDYLHIDYWTPEGTGFGFTPISLDPTQELVWKATSVAQSEWNSYDVPMSYFKDGGVDLTNIKQFKVDNGGGVYGYIANIYFYKSDENPGGGDEPSTDEGNGKTYYGQITGTYEKGNLDGQAYTFDWNATWNENGTVTFEATVDPKPVGIVVQLFVNNVFVEENFTNNGTNFTYTTKDKFKEGETPFGLQLSYADGTTGIKSIDYAVGASNDKPENPGGGDGDVVGNGKTYYGQLTGTYVNGNLDGQAYTFDWNATWNENGTVTFEANVDPKPEGLVVQLFVNNAFVEENFSNNGTNFTYTTKDKFKEGETPFGLQLSYALGSTGVKSIDYAVGASNDKPENPGGGDGDDDDDDNMTFVFNGTTYTVDWSATWNTNETITFNISFNPEADPSFVPQLVENGSIFTNFTKEDTSWTATTQGTYDEGATPNLALYVAYAGGGTSHMPFNYTVEGSGTGAVDAFEATEAPVEFFNLQGVKVANPQNGIFIMRQGDKARKVLVK